MKNIDVLALLMIFVLGWQSIPPDSPSAQKKFLTLPDSISFCDERIPIEDDEVRERLEEIFYVRLVSDRANLLLLKRSGKYFQTFDRLLAEMNAPADLKYLSVAESALKVDAYSRAGAAGLWQFIPETARAWGLTVNKHVDERFHVEKSTRAAIRMMTSLKDKYGSWCLAAAAYNAGPGNINDVVRKQQVDNYFDAFLNKETRYYIFHIAILKELFTHPSRYGYDSLAAYAPYDDSTVVDTVNGPILDLASWAQTRGTPYKTLKLLNYWIMDYSLPAGTYEIRLPQSRKIAFAETVAEPDTAKAQGRITIEHTVRPGDYLLKIARQYEVDLEDVKKWNGLASDVAPLGARLKILVPPLRRVLHRVEAGDNLTRIAERYRVTIEQIRTWNEIPDDVARLGSELVIFVGK